MIIQETRKVGSWPRVAEGDARVGYSSGPGNTWADLPVNFTLPTVTGREFCVRMTNAEFDKLVDDVNRMRADHILNHDDALVLDQFNTVFPGGMMLRRVRIGPTVRYDACDAKSRLAFRKQIEKLVTLGTIRRILAEGEESDNMTWPDRIYQITDAGRVALKEKS